MASEVWDSQYVGWNVQSDVGIDMECCANTSITSWKEVVLNMQ